VSHNCKLALFDVEKRKERRTELMGVSRHRTTKQNKTKQGTTRRIKSKSNLIRRDEFRNQSEGKVRGDGEASSSTQDP